jgi:hypothetical protein
MRYTDLHVIRYHLGILERHVQFTEYCSPELHISAKKSVNSIRSLPGEDLMGIAYGYKYHRQGMQN